MPATSTGFQTYWYQLPWSSKVPKRIGDGTGNPAVIEQEIIDNLRVRMIGAQGFDPYIYPWVNIADITYEGGAKGNGKDDQPAIMAAWAAAKAQVGVGVVLVPPGVWSVGSQCDFRTDDGLVILLGFGRAVSILKARDGAALDNPFLFGAEDGSDVNGNSVTIIGVGFDGNKAAGGAGSPTTVVDIYNANTPIVKDVSVFNGPADGLRMRGRHSSQDNNFWNAYGEVSDVYATANDGDGVYFANMRERLHRNVTAVLNGQRGVVVTTEGSSQTGNPDCQFVGLTATSNGQDTVVEGVAVDSCPNLAVDGLVARGNSGVGLKVGTAANVAYRTSGVLSSVRATDNGGSTLADVQGVEIETTAALDLALPDLYVQGSAASEAGDKVGVKATSAAGLQLGGVVRSVKGTGVHLVSCTDVDIPALRVVSCGGNTTADNHGLHLESCGVVLGGRLILDNAETNAAGGGYEFYNDGSTGVKIDTVQAESDDAGREYGFGAAADRVQTKVGASLLAGNSWASYTMAAASSLTIPPGIETVQLSAGDTITDIARMSPGTHVTLWGAAAFDMVDGGFQQMAGDLTAGAGDSIMLTCYGAAWIEVSRSNN